MKVFIANISSVDRCRVNLNIANINKCCTGKVVWASLPIHKCSVIVHLEITWLTRTGRSNFMCSARDEFYRNKNNTIHYCFLCGKLWGCYTWQTAHCQHVPTYRCFSRAVTRVLNTCFTRMYESFF